MVFPPACWLLRQVLEVRKQCLDEEPIIQVGLLWLPYSRKAVSCKPLLLNVAGLSCWKVLLETVLCCEALFASDREHRTVYAYRV